MEYIHTPKGILFLGDYVKIRCKNYDEKTNQYTSTVNPYDLEVIEIDEEGFITAIGVKQPLWVFKGGAIVQIKRRLKMNKTIVRLATEVAEALEDRTRKNGEVYVAFKDGSPEWMIDLAIAAHANMYSDDERYRLFAKVIYGIAELDPNADEDDIFDILYEDYSTFQPDIYTKKLLDWLSSDLGRHHYVDEAIEAFGYPGEIMKAIGAGQVEELREIASLVIEFLKDMLD